VDVEKRNVGSVVERKLDRFFGACSFGTDLAAARLERSTDLTPNPGVVVGYYQSDRLLRHHVTVTTLPLPGFESMASDPGRLRARSRMLTKP
jgi:hypothetical protein